MRTSAPVALALASLACAGPAPREAVAEPAPPRTRPAPIEAASAAPEPEPAPEPEGPELPERGRFVEVGRHWASLHRICDLEAFGGALFAAHATSPLGLGGATLTRYDPDAKPALTVAFDWNRAGQPETGGGAAGQGFLRIRNVDGRLWVPDADPPYLGFGIARGMAEGYVFVSDEHGRFEAASRPGKRPPKSALVLPGGLHVFDAVSFRGRAYVSASALVPPSGKNASAPGVLFSQRDGSWEVALTYAGRSRSGARLGYMAAYRDRLYVALSPLDGSDPHDYLVATPPDASARAVRATRGGSAHTLRWYVDGERLYWIAATRDGIGLFVTTDGERWSLVSLPSEAGHPTDLLRVGRRLLILTERALLEIASNTTREIARVADDQKTPFELDDVYCAAPLALFRDELYAGGQKKGRLFKLVGE